MALLNFGGFEHGDMSEANSTTGTLTLDEGAPLGIGTVRSGNYALRVDLFPGTGTYYVGSYSAAGQKGNLSRTAETWYIFHIRFERLPAADSIIASVATSAGAIVASVNVDAAGLLTGVWATTSATAATLVTNVWYEVEMRVTSNLTSAVRVDGATEQTFTAANATQGGLQFGTETASNYAVLVDEWGIDDTAFIT